MPLYAYRRRDNGRLIELLMSLGEFRKLGQRRKDGGLVLEDGTVADQEIVLHPRPRRAANLNTYPRVSQAAGVGVNQVAAAREEARRAGFSDTQVDFNGDGDAVFGSRRAEKQYLRRIGMCNKGMSD